MSLICVSVLDVICLHLLDTLILYDVSLKFIVVIALNLYFDMLTKDAFRLSPTYINSRKKKVTESALIKVMIQASKI